MIDNTSFLDTLRMQRIETGENKTARALSSTDSPRRGNGSFNAILKENIDLTTARGREKKKLIDACYDMESIFVGKMLKEMRNTVHKNDWFHGGFAEEIFEDMLYDEYAKELSRNSNLGLANMLYKELSAKI
ncbi:MAG TPA: rod-binding protein [Spirochaetota bacterium]|nr:rod-binding protein [Spirochaetota bacterium]HPI90312.1 rod-binding protein [Spirochaetota bacterium]HPR49728.1 rod-binding protein [Spirochaetota bacterium]